MKNYIFAFVFIVISLPLAQYILSFAKTEPLHGENPKPDIAFEPPKWDHSEYQTIKEAYLTQNFGFRSPLIRAHNELEYRLFGKMNRIGARLGKENYLFDIEYIEEYMGTKKRAYLPAAVYTQMEKLQGLKDSLAKRNILLLVVFAPSKAHYCAEYLPEKYQKRADTTLYDALTLQCQKRNIPYIDFNRYFISLKKTTPYPLFVKTGIHWTAYGAAIAMDSVFKRLEKEKNMDMPDFDWSQMEISDKARGTDDDVMRLNNLYSYFKTPQMAYPKLSFLAKEGQKKLKALTIGDSFWWDFHYSGANEQFFDKSEFWVYFDEIFTTTTRQKLDRNNTRRGIEKYDVVIIESTGCNLHEFSFGFIETANQQFTQSREEYQKKWTAKVEAYKKEIPNNPQWIYNLRKEAKAQNITEDSVIRRAAMYMATEDLK